MKEEMLPRKKPAMMIECKSPSIQLLRDYAPLGPIARCPSLRMHQAPDFYRFWDEWEKENGHTCEIPFWCVVWPAAEVMADYITRQRECVEGMRVLDVGCGGGAAAIAAALAGAASVVANDIDPIARDVTRINAAHNNVSLEYSERDITNIDLAADADVVLVSDMFYEEAVAHSHFEWLTMQHIRYGKRVLIADAQRPFLPHNNLSCVYDCRLNVDRELEGVHTRDVSVLTFQTK